MEVVRKLKNMRGQVSRMEGSTHSSFCSALVLFFLLSVGGDLLQDLVVVVHGEDLLLEPLKLLLPQILQYMKPIIEKERRSVKCMCVNNPCTVTHTMLV
jgi:hypothetical protein